MHSIHLTRKGKQALRTCDGYEELLNYLRSDIQEIASRLQKGGLGYLDEDVDIEDQVSRFSFLASCAHTDPKHHPGTSTTSSLRS